MGTAGYSRRIGHNHFLLEIRMKKIAGLFVCFVFLFSLAAIGCGGQVGEKGAATDTPKMDPDQQKLREQTMKGQAKNQPKKDE